MVNNKDLVTYEDLLKLRDKLVLFNYGFVGGAWDGGLHYRANNIVYYNKRLYICHADAPVGTLPTNRTYWKRLEFIQHEYVTTEEDSLLVSDNGYAIVLSEGE